MHSSAVWNCSRQKEQVAPVLRENKKEETYFIVNTTIHIRLGVYSKLSFLKTFFKYQMRIRFEKERANCIVSNINIKV